MIPLFQRVEKWCMGANDTFGTCAFAMCGNLHALVTTALGRPEIMSDGEIEAMDHAITGFTPTDRSTDHGVALETLLTYWTSHGWVGDPTFRPSNWARTNDVVGTIDRLGACCAWAKLPVGEDGQYDFSDEAVARGEPGIYAHAMLIVDPQWSVTWGRLQAVSPLWWSIYGGGFYAVRHPLWQNRS